MLKFEIGLELPVGVDLMPNKDSRQSIHPKTFILASIILIIDHLV